MFNFQEYPADCDRHVDDVREAHAEGIRAQDSGLRRQSTPTGRGMLLYREVEGNILYRGIQRPIWTDKTS